MRHFVKTTMLGAAMVSLVMPFGVQAKESGEREHARMKNPVSVEAADRASERELSKNEHSNKVRKTTGVVKAISATSITVTNSKKVDTTFVIDAKTRMLRKHHGKASVNEIVVGDHVKVWSSKTTPGTAKMIWDKDIWAVRFPGTISNLDTTNKTMTLTIKWKMFDVTSTVKWDDTLVVKQGEVTKAVTDLANGQKVTVSGSWNDIGKFIFAKKINLPK
jgi:hypothetical protein